MTETKTTNRWLIVFGAILIQLCLGAIYAWSVFTKELTRADGPYNFSATEVAWIFSVGLAVFAVTMVFTGRVLPKFSPRSITICSALVLGMGYIGGGFMGGGFWSQLFFIGVIGGAGIGIGYVVPIAVGVKWFPDKKGLLAGLAVAGFGFGATIWVKLGGSWFGGLIKTCSLFGLPGVQSTFIIYGLAFMALILTGSIFMINPPRGWVPKGWKPADQTSTDATGTIELTSKQMLKTPQFYGLWLMFMGSALPGLMVIYCIRLFGTDSLVANGAVQSIDQAGAIAGTAMAWYAILNGIGRIAWGSLSDKLSRKFTLLIMCLFQGVTLLVFFELGKTISGLILGACIIGFNFGGNFALFPAATADFFGNKNVGQNYGWIFLAYGIAGIAGPLIAGFFKDAAKGGDVSAWSTPFIIAGVCCIVAAVIGIFLKPPQKTAVA